MQYLAKNPSQKVTDIEGQVFILDPDGAGRQVKLDKTSIFDEEVDGKWRRRRFTLPALAPGVVVECRYMIISPNNNLLPDWEFQTSVPTRWSEFRAEIPEIFKHMIVEQGVDSFAVKKN